MIWWLAQNAIGSAALAACVALITRIGKFSPAACHALWLIVILKMVTPPIPAWTWPVSTPQFTARLGAASVLAPNTFDSQSMLTLAVYCVAAIWIAGAVGMALFQIYRQYRLHAAIVRSDDAPQWMHRAVASLAAELRISPPRIAVVRDAQVPLLVSGLRPTLVIPDALLDKLDRNAWRSALAHELIHLKRRDHWIAWLELAAVCLWWWNPVFWYAWHRLRENAEFACDAWVVQLLPEGRRGYAESLIAVADSLSSNLLPIGAIGMAATCKRIFERRLTMILHDATPSRMSPRFGVAAIALAIAILPYWSQSNATADTPSDSKATAGVSMGLSGGTVDGASQKRAGSMGLSGGQVSQSTTPAGTSNMSGGQTGSMGFGSQSNVQTSTSGIKSSNTVGIVSQSNSQAGTPNNISNVKNTGIVFGSDAVVDKTTTRGRAPNKATNSKNSAMSTGTSGTVDKGIVKTGTSDENVAGTSNETIKSSGATSKMTELDSPSAVPQTIAVPKKSLPYPLFDKSNAEPISPHSGLQNIEVHGESRIRFNSYSVH